MALKFNTGKFSEKDDFEYIARILAFREVDLTPEERTNYNAEPGTDQYQLLIQLEGVSIEWVGDEGNLRTFTAKLTTPAGAEKKGRNFKAYHILRYLLAPVDETEAEEAGYVDSKGRGLPGLGYDEAASSFPECLEGKVVKVAHKFIAFGTDKATGEAMRSMIPAILEVLPDDYVHEGKVSKITYKGRKTSSLEPGEPGSPVVDDSDVTVAEAADPSEFFAAIDGQKLHLQALHEATKDNPGLQVEPYRTLIASKAGRAALAASGCIVLDDSTPPTIEVVDILDLAALEALADAARSTK